HYARGERQRGDRRPRRNGAVVRTERRATRGVVVELSLAPTDPGDRVAGPVGGREAPAVFFVAYELARIADRVLAMDLGRHPAVLEVVGVLGGHEAVADPAQVQPDVRELVDEKRSRVQHVLAVQVPPAVARGPGVIGDRL